MTWTPAPERARVPFEVIRFALRQLPGELSARRVDQWLEFNATGPFVQDLCVFLTGGVRTGWVQTG
jgi:hypothetical protein